MRIDVNGTLMEGRRFIAANKGKALICLGLALVAMVVGIANALSIEEVTRQGLMRFNVFLVLAGERSFWGYFFFRFLLLFLLVIAISVVGFRPAVSWLSFVVVILFSYQASYFICIMFMYGTFAVLPLMLVVVVPFSLIALCVLIFYSCFILKLSTMAKVCRISDISYYVKSVLLPLIFASLVLLVLAIIEGVLVMLFTIGITM